MARELHEEEDISPASSLKQHRLNRLARSNFLTEFGVLDSEEVDILVARKSKNMTAADFVSQGKLFSVEISDKTYFPKFQFTPIAKTVKPAIAMVLAELPQTLKDNKWSLALWWTTPSATLNGRCPVDVVGSNYTLAVDAAVAERKNWEADNPISNP